MKTNKMVSLQNLVKDFEREIIFNTKEENQDVLAVFIDHKSNERRAAIIAKEKANIDAVNSIAKKHFGPASYKVIKRSGMPESTATLQTGKGIRHVNLPAWGTIGGVFNRKNDVHQYGLSNTHVIADVNNVRQGDDCIYHPNIIAGELFNWFILKPPPAVNKMDAALFKISSKHNTKWSPVKPTKWIGPRINLRVYKNGKTTNITNGTIKSYNGSAKVRLNGKLYFFSGIMAIRSSAEHFNKAGDSGSVVFSESGHHMVGLVFAKFHSYCWALPISRIKPLLR